MVWFGQWLIWGGNTAFLEPWWHRDLCEENSSPLTLAFPFQPSMFSSCFQGVHSNASHSLPHQTVHEMQDNPHHTSRHPLKNPNIISQTDDIQSVHSPDTLLFQVPYSPSVPTHGQALPKDPETFLLCTTPKCCEWNGIWPFWSPGGI